MSLALYICSLPLFRIDRIEMVLDHTRKTFQEIFRYVNNSDLSEESVD